MPNLTRYWCIWLLCCSSCMAETALDQAEHLEIPTFLQEKFHLQRIINSVRIPARLEHSFRERAEAQFPVFAQEADFQDLTQLHFTCFDLYLSPLDEPGDYLAFLYTPAGNMRVLFVEWGLQNSLYYQQVLASNGEGLRYFEGMGFEGEENSSNYSFVHALSWLNRYKKDCTDWLKDEPTALATWIKGIPVGGILALHAYAAVYLD
jgi:hypothetical protein